MNTVFTGHICPASHNLIAGNTKTGPQAFPHNSDRTMSASETTVDRRLKQRWVWTLATCCVVAIGISSYLAWTALTSSKIAGCGGGRLFNCGHVINSQWSLWMGIPVSLMAIGNYAILGVALWLGATRRMSVSMSNMAWTVVTLTALSAGAAAIWFTGLQFFILKHLCSYCLVAHCCGLIASAIVIGCRPAGSGSLKLLMPLALVGLGGLIAGQIYGPLPKTYEIETFDVSPAEGGADMFEAPVPGMEGAPSQSDETLFEAPVSMKATAAQSWVANRFIDRAAETLVTIKPSLAVRTLPMIAAPIQEPAKEKRTVGMSGGTVKLDVTQWPINGSTKARYIFIEMFDYCCPSCRKTHTAITGAKKALGGDVAVIVLPVPLNAGCNSTIQTTDLKFAESCGLSKLAVAVWRTDADKFGAFHEFMFVGEKAPSYAQALLHARSLVDPQKLDAELATEIPAKYIVSMVQLYERAGKGNVPKLMFPGTSIVGEFASAEALADVIKKEAK